MHCNYCMSEYLCLKSQEGKTSLFCRNCDRWIRYVGDSEIMEVLKQIERQNREIKIDGADVERTKNSLKSYQEKLESLNAEYTAYKTKTEKSKISNAHTRSTLFKITLEIKETSAKISAYKEVLALLRL